MLPEAYIAHRTPGRLRIKIPSRKGNEEYFSSLKAHLSQLDGLERLEVNPVTGSVLFVTAADTKEIADHGAEKQLFILSGRHGAPATLSQRVVRDFDRLNHRVMKFTSGEIDIASVAFLGLVGAGIYQISVGNFMAPAWYTAFWYALNISLKARGDDSADLMS